MKNSIKLQERNIVISGIGMILFVGFLMSAIPLTAYYLEKKNSHKLTAK